MKSLYFITTLLLFSCITTAQNHFEIEEGETQVFFTPKDQSQFEICGLEKGVEYIYSFSFPRGKKAFKVSGENNTQIIGEHKFVAKSACKSFTFEVGNEVTSADLLEFLIFTDISVDPRRQMTFNAEASNNPRQLINDIFQNNKCFEIIESSIELKGNIGTYENGEVLGTSEGIIMATGPVDYAEGPNNRTGNGNNGGGSEIDDDLSVLSGGYDTYDLTTIEFDFIPTGGYISFQYLFASEEYCDYVDTEFNDAFGFFLSGDGINGAFTNNADNLAIVNGGAPVSINTINFEANGNQYISNVPLAQIQNDIGCTFEELFLTGAAAREEIQYDGFTRLQSVFAEVTPCEVYHLKLAIADVGDGAFDSAVFLRARSFFAGGDALLGADANGSADELVVYENCGRQDLTIQIERGPESVLEESMFIGLDVGGTATVFEDYSFFVPFHEIPPFQEVFEIPISIVSDDIPEGTETIEITLSTACTCELPVIEIEIREIEPMELQLQASPACNGSDVIITSSLSGGAPDYKYKWNNGFTGTFIEVDPASREFFSLQVKDDCGNEVSDTIYLDILDAPMASLSGDEIICDETESANFTIDIEGQGPFELVIMNPLGGLDTLYTEEQSITIMDSIPGQYQLVSVSGLCPGEVEGLANIEINDLEIELLSENPLCNGEADGLASLSISGGQGPFIVEWIDGSDLMTLENLTAGNYSVTVTDEAGCVQVSNVVLEEPVELVVEITPQGISTCTNPEGGSISLNITGGTEPYIFSWNNGEETESLSLLETGLYVVTVTDQNGCSTVMEGEIPGDNSLPEAMAISPDVLNCDNQVVLISSAGSSEGTEFVYTWTNAAGETIGSNSNMLEVDAAGFYTLNVTNSINGCSAEFIAEVSDNFMVPTGDPLISDILNCINQEVQISIENLSDNTTVTWASNQGNGISSTTEFSAMVSSEGTYTATLINIENGCQDIIEFVVDQDLTVPVISLDTPPLLTCGETIFFFDGSINNPNTNYTYEWFFNNTQISENPEVEIDQVGNYDLVVTNTVTGCTSIDNITVLENIETPIFTLSDPGEFGCQDNSLDISSAISSGGADGFEYNWETFDGSIISSSNESEISISAGGTYILTLTDLNNGCTSREQIIIEEDIDKPIIEILPFDILNCENDELVLDASASSQGSEFSFSWQTSTGVSLDDNSLVQTVSEEGTYTLIITNTLNGCVSEEVFMVAQNTEAPELVVNQPDVLGCTIQEVTLSLNNADEDFSYSWSTSSQGSINSDPTAENVQVSQAGNYEVIVTNNLTGCTSLYDVDVLSNSELPEVNAGDTFTIDCSQDQFFLAGSTNLDLSNIEVLWTTIDGTFVGNDNSLDVQISSGGTYILTVTNLTNGCASENEITINEDINLPVFDLPQPDVLTCDMQSIELNVENFDSSLDLSFIWTQNGQILDGEISETISATTIGEYSVLVTNNTTGCTDTKTVNLEEDMVTPMANAGSNQELDCNSDILSLQGEGSPGVMFEYFWTTDNGVILDGQNTLSPTISASGEYTLLVTNLLNGCTNSSSLLISPNDEAPIIQSSTPDFLTCDNVQTNITADVSNVEDGFTFMWTGPEGYTNSSDLSIDVNIPGDYILTVISDDNGCESNFSVPVSQDLTGPEILIAEPAEITCIQSTVEIVTGNLDDTSVYLYSWSTTDGEIVSMTNLDNIEVSSAGTYIVDVVNQATGCTSTQSIDVLNNLAPPVFALSPENVIDCDNPLGFINILTEDDAAALAADWQVPLSGSIELIEVDENKVSVNEAGVYTLILTNLENGCTAEQDVVVDDNFEIPIVTSDISGILNCTNQSVDLNIQNVEGMNLSYQWVNENQEVSGFTSNQITINMQGEYTAIITNEDNGCMIEVPLLVQENIDEPIANILGDNQLNCDVTSINLQASDVDSTNEYLWINESGNVVSTSSIFDVNTGGAYTLIVTNPLSECVQEDEIVISQTADLPDFSFDDPLILDCRNMESVISVQTIDPELLFSFTTQNGNIVSSDERTFEVNEPGIYSITAVNNLTGCERVLEVEVSQDIESPIVDAGPGFELNCTDVAFQLQGSTNLNQNFSFEWLVNEPDVVLAAENTLSPTTSVPGIYTLVVTNERNGCIAIDEVEITEVENIPSGISASIIEPLCAGDLGGLDIFQIDGGQGPYLYSIDNGTSYFNEGLFEQLTPGVYDLLVQDQNGCEIGTQLEIPEVAEVFVSLPPDLELEFGDDAQLLASTNIEPQDIATITWSPSTNLTCADCLSPQVVGVANELYTVTIVNENGCVAEANIQLRVNRNINVYIPNAFSPKNIDGVNDVFMIFAKDGIVANINSFQVYDKWGTQVFVDENFLPNDPAHGWNGAFRGDKMNPGVFVFWAEIEFIDGSTSIFKGDVTLMD